MGFTYNLIKNKILIFKLLYYGNWVNAALLFHLINYVVMKIYVALRFTFVVKSLVELKNTIICHTTDFHDILSSSV